jgi:hypothetical protein
LMAFFDGGLKIESLGDDEEAPAGRESFRVLSFSLHPPGPSLSFSHRMDAAMRSGLDPSRSIECSNVQTQREREREREREKTERERGRDGGVLSPKNADMRGCEVSVRVRALGGARPNPLLLWWYAAVG